MEALQGRFARQAAPGLGIGAADVVPGDSAMTVQAPIQRNLSPAQRAGTVVVDG